jgi:hypothetical protein
VIQKTKAYKEFVFLNCMDEYLIFKGPAVGFYKSYQKLGKIVKENGGKYVVCNLASSQKLSGFEIDEVSFHLKGTTIIYTSRRTYEIEREASIKVFGTNEAVTEIEGIIQKAEIDYRLSQKD